MGTKSKDEKRFQTLSGLSVQNTYRPQDRSSEKLESPGEFPFTRGIRANMYRGKLWTMRQYAGFGSAEETNARYRYLLEQGSTGLSVAFDLPTQMGRDPDDPICAGEIGRVGVSIATIDDMRALFEGIPLDQVSVSMTINSTAPILLAMLLVVAEEQGVPWKQVRGTTQNDILKEYIARGTYIYPPRHSLRLVTDLFAFCANEVPKWNTISISGYHIREAGSTAIQELAFTFANAITYVEAALDANLSIDDFAQRLAFFFNCQVDFLEEVAKFRAARRIWAKIMKERFRAEEERSCWLRFHTQTAGSSLTAQQPLNNIVRTAVEALAAVCGGTQSLHTNAYDEALGLPTEESARVALRTQQILAEESGVANTVDPFAGSYCIDHWTSRFEDQVFQEIEKIDAMGGMLAAIEAGYPQGEIERAAFEHQRSCEDGHRRIVGVNCYTEESEPETPVLSVSEEVELRQKERLAEVRRSRNSKQHQASLSALGEAAESGGPLFPLLLSSVRASASVGEISSTLEESFGRYRP